MKLNLKVRAKNPVFWINLAVSLMGIILAYFGLNWEQMTTWKSITDMLLQAIQNPVVVIAVLGASGMRLMTLRRQDYLIAPGH